MNVKKLYAIFFIVYFTLGVFEAYFVLYLPLYYYEILNVNRSNLAFIQFLGYFSLIVTPVFAYIFDKYVKSERNQKIVVLFCSISLCSCFSIFLYNKNILVLYGIFLGVYFLSRTFIRTIMSKLFLTLSVNSPKIKHNMILIVNGATAVSFLFVSLFFDFTIQNLYSQQQWGMFFIIGWLLTLPLISIILLLRKSTIFTGYKKKNEKINIAQNIERNKGKTKPWFVIFLYIAFFLASSDLIFLSLVSSWVFTTHGEESLRFFFSFYYIFNIFSLLGYLVASKIAKKISNIFLLFVFCSFYLFFLSFLPFSNFPLFIILQCSLSIVGYIANYMFVSISQTISVNTRYKTLTFQTLLTCQSIARIVFTPLGTSLSATASVEMLIFISTILLSFSCLLQLVLVLVIKFKQVKGFNK